MSLVDQLYEDVQPAANDSEAWQSGDLPDVGAGRVTSVVRPATIFVDALAVPLLLITNWILARTLLVRISGIYHRTILQALRFRPL